jgi:predicted nucleotidyltransferase
MLFKEAKVKIRKHKRDLSNLGVRSLALFGSIARNEGSPNSDVDILIEFDPKKGLLEFMDVKNHLEEFLGCEVDLVTKDALHPALKKRILQEAKYVF